jgi:hypothetical protein
MSARLDLANRRMCCWRALPEDSRPNREDRARGSNRMLFLVALTVEVVVLLLAEGAAPVESTRVSAGAGESEQTGAEPFSAQPAQVTSPYHDKPTSIGGPGGPIPLPK